MRSMLLLVFGMYATPEECAALLAEIGSACDKTGMGLIVTNDPVRAVAALSKQNLQVVHIVNESNISRFVCANVCQLLADELVLLEKKPLINIGDPAIRFLSTIFRQQGIIPLETDLKTAVVRRWNELQTVPAT